jgi:cytochrome oxidase Cu insertion factor (SCO1/SenC/PrrC family)
VDRPEVLRQYAAARGADLSNWSFLTGEREVVAPLVTRWGVGSLRKEDGSIDHTLITFLVHEGRVMERYTTREGRDEALLADVVVLAEARRAKREVDAP